MIIKVHPFKQSFSHIRHCQDVVRGSVVITEVLGWIQYVCFRFQKIRYGRLALVVYSNQFLHLLWGVILQQPYSLGDTVAWYNLPNCQQPWPKNVTKINWFLMPYMYFHIYNTNCNHKGEVTLAHCQIYNTNGSLYWEATFFFALS